jgi:hypothetical protein
LPTKSNEQGLKKLFEIRPFFLLTIPLFIIVHIEQDYQNLIVYKFVWSEIAELFAASFIITGILFLTVRNFRRACIYALPVILAYYFFCDIKDTLNTWNDKSFMSSYIFLLPTTMVFLFIIFRFINRSRSEFKRLFLFVNIAFVLFIFFDLAIIGWRAFSNTKTTPGKYSLVRGKYNPCDSCVRPDIYYIVFDAYTSSAVLKSEFNYDNSDLDSFLRKKDFYIVQHSTSNYNLTPFSIGSTLNADYLPSVNTRKEFYLDEYLPGISIVHKNRLIPLFKQEGYQIINHSIFSFDQSPSTIPIFDLWELNLIYERHNIIKKIDRDIGWILWPKLRRLTANIISDRQHYAIERDRFFENTVKSVFETIKSHTDPPKFVYAHMLLPHAPYTYDSLGNKISFSGKDLPADEDKKAYIGQLVYANKIIKTLIDSIFSHSKKPFIIILQGDHGYKYNEANKNTLEFANLNAMYFYNKDYRRLHDSLSNVNTFRIIFDTFFSADYPLLKDTAYFLQYK